MKDLLLIVLLISGLFLSAQKDTVQSITLSKIEVSSPITNTSGVSGVEIVFAVKFKYPIDDFFNEVYKIVPRIHSKEEIIVLDDRSVNGTAHASPEHNGFDEYVSIFVPYHKIKLDFGMHLVSIELYAIHDEFSDIPVFHKDLYEITVPKFYNYSEQKIKISNFQSSIKEENGVQGIQLDFISEYLFPNDRISSVSSNNERLYYYYATIHTPERPLIYKPELTPKEQPSIGWNPYNSQFAVPSENPQKNSLFIPFNQLQLLNGSYNVEIELHACNYSGDIQFSSIASTKINLEYPNVYCSKLNAKNIKIAYGEYDVAGKNIPIIGAFTGGKKNRGKGYPDVIWKIKTGNHEIFRTGIARNSFTAYDDSCYFKTLESEPISLIIADYDAVGADDVLGRYLIKPQMGEFTLDIKEHTSDKVVNLDMTYNKERIHIWNNRGIQTKHISIGKTTGFTTTISYDTANFINREVDVNYVILDSLHNIIEPDFLQAETDLILDKEKVLFVPYFMLPPKSIFGIQIRSDEISSQPILETLIDPDFQMPEKLNDITFRDSTLTLQQSNGYSRFFSPLIPDKYDHQSLFIEYKVRDFQTGEFIEQPLYMYHGIYIPYYKYADRDEMKILIYKTAKVKETGYIVGEEEEIVTYKIPHLDTLQILSFSGKFKTNKVQYQKVYWKVDQDIDKVCQSESIVPEKEMLWKLQVGNKIVVHEHDEIIITLYGLSDTGYELELGQWRFYGRDFKKGQRKLKLKKSFYLKKLEVIYAKK